MHPALARDASVAEEGKIDMSQLELPTREDAMEDLLELEPIDEPPSVLSAVGAVKALKRSSSLQASECVGATDGTTGLMLPDRQTFLTIARRVIRTTAPLLAADVVGLVLSGIIAGVIVAWISPNVEFVARVAPIGLLPLLAAFWLHDLYAEIWVHPAVELRQLTHLTVFGLTAAAVGGIIIPSVPLYCLTACPMAILLVPLLRTVARRLCCEESWWGYPTLVIGTSPVIESVLHILLDAPRSGLRPVIASDPDARCRKTDIPVVNDIDELRSLVRARAIRHAVAAIPGVSAAELTEILDRYSGLVPHLLVLSDIQTLPSLWGASRSSGRLSGIEVRNALLMATLQWIKRALDLAIAVCVLVTASIPLLIIALLVKLTSRGPAFFGHERVGHHGRFFKAWKFRTMYGNGKEILRKHIDSNPAARAEWDRDQKLRNDPRVTPLGRILRKFSLDELPQIWNVLAGDMSLVGPRPIVEDEVARYGANFRLYTSVKPGITGLWQVSGRNDTTYRDRILLDLFYVRHWSPWLDVYILAKTVVALISRDGAY
jgi:Undecaprenyl-phosphate galactose phosphotransferase WbaP